MHTIFKWAFLLGMTGGMAAFADVIHLKDGSKVEGDIRRADRGWEIKQANGKTITVSEDDVESIELAKRDTKDDPQLRLDSLRRIADGQGDIAQVITRYEKLITDLGDSPVAATAKNDLEIWKQRLAAGMVKVGGKWLDKTAVARLDERSFVGVEQAKNAMKAAKYPEAGQAVDRVLADDPDNVGALYLKGLLLAKQNQPGLAKKTWEQVIAQMPDHAPTLNNIAVLQWRLRQFILALVNFEKAVTAAPANQLILDNLTEIFNDLPRDVQGSPALRRLNAKFKEQEPQLEAKLEESGWYRWGSTWVSKQQLAQLKAQEELIKEKLNKLAREYDDAQAAIDRIDNDIAANNRSLNTIEANRLVKDSQGNITRLPYPDVYYQILRDQDQLDGRRKEAVRKLDTIRADADRVRSQLAVPPYTGQLRLMDEQQVPVLLRSVKKSAATQPATR